jgi:hypothetical protein
MDFLEKSPQKSWMFRKKSAKNIIKLGCLKKACKDMIKLEKYKKSAKNTIKLEISISNFF